MQNIIPIESPFALLFVLLALNSIFVAPMATAILLWYRDVGLLFLASLPVTFVWTGVLSWYIQGDLLESIVTTLNDPFSPSPLWWLYSFWCIYSCGLPLALLSLIIHTGRYLWREYKGNDEVTLASLSIKVGE